MANYITFAQAAAIAREHWHRRITTLNQWSAEAAAGTPERWRRIELVQNLEDILIEIFDWCDGQWSPRDFALCLETARKAAVNAIHALDESVGGDPQHPDREHLRGLIDLWQLMRRHALRWRVPREKILDWRGEPPFLESKWEMAS